MVRRKPATQSSLTVPVLLNEAQRASSSGHLRYAKVMWELQGEDAEQTLEQLMFALKLFMTVAEVGGGRSLIRGRSPCSCDVFSAR